MHYEVVLERSSPPIDSVFSLFTAASFLFRPLLLVQFDALGHFIAIFCLTDRALLHHLLLLFDSFIEQGLRDAIKCILDAFAVDCCCFLIWNVSIGPAPVHYLTWLNLPFTLQVFFVPEDKERKVLWVFWHALFKEVSSPVLQILKALIIGDIAD